MTDITNIFLVRHGQTEWNQQNRLQGQRNSPLTETGRQQALMARESLDKYILHKAYVSPLQRAQDTLDIILQGRDTEVVKSENLKEISLGPWEGKTREETQQTHPIEYHRFWNNQDKFILPGAETFDQLQSRVVAALNSIFAGETGRNILVVSHWIAIKVALAHYTTTALQQLSSISDPENGTLLTLTSRCDEISVHGA